MVIPLLDVKQGEIYRSFEYNEVTNQIQVFTLDPNNLSVIYKEMIEQDRRVKL